MDIESRPCPECGEYGLVYDGLLAWRSGPRPPRKLASKRAFFSPRADYERERIYHCDHCGAEFYQDVEQSRVHLYREGVSGQYLYSALQGDWEFRFFDRTKREWVVRPVKAWEKRPGWIEGALQSARSLFSPSIEDGQPYVVQEGDSLPQLAATFYGDPSAWPTIWKATNLRFMSDDSFMIVADPTTLRVGCKLRIPAEAERSMSAADESTSRMSGVFVARSSGPYRLRSDATRSRAYSSDNKPIGPTWHVLRFYQDGLVLSVTIQTRDVARDWPRIGRWFHRDNEHPVHSSGKYCLIGDHLSLFTCLEREKRVYYAGTYLEDTLRLSSFSYKDREYVRLPGCE